VLGDPTRFDPKCSRKPQFHSAERSLLRVHLFGTDFRIGEKRSANTRTYLILCSDSLYHQIDFSAVEIGFPLLFLFHRILFYIFSILFLFPISFSFLFFSTTILQISEHHYDVPHLVSPSPPPLPPGLNFQSSPECEPPISLMSLASSPRPSSHTSTIDKAPHSDSERSLSSTLSSSCNNYLSFILYSIISIYSTIVHKTFVTTQ